MSVTTEITDYMGLRGLLSDEEKLVQQTAREFVNREVIPIIDSYAQEEKFPAHLVKPMGGLGFLGPVPAGGIRLRRTLERRLRHPDVRAGKR